MRFSLIVLILVSLTFSGESQEKINGVSFVALPNAVTNEMLDPVCATHANWITLMPYAYGRNGQSGLRIVEKGWWGETPEGVEESIKAAQLRGLKVMIKPHLWLGHGDYTGHFELQSDAEWKVFESDYYDYIMVFARLSAKYDLPLMCIGTELTKFSEQRPTFWRRLIKDIRTIYKGKLTYAANWDSFHVIPFWDDLDYIGLDAYFPLCDQQTPSLKALMRGWQPHFNDIQSFSQNANKEVLFTEWGYRSTDYCAKEPWDYSKSGEVNMDAQYNAYQAVFKQFWHQSWFAGGFIWKWFPTHTRSGGLTDNWFTPQNKPVQDLIQQWYSTNKSN